MQEHLLERQEHRKRQAASGAAELCGQVLEAWVAFSHATSAGACTAMASSDISLSDLAFAMELGDELTMHETCVAEAEFMKKALPDWVRSHSIDAFRAAIEGIDVELRAVSSDSSTSGRGNAALQKSVLNKVAAPAGSIPRLWSVETVEQTGSLQNPGGTSFPSSRSLSPSPAADSGRQPGNLPIW